MANPMVLLRGLYGGILPLTAILAYRTRRRFRLGGRPEIDSATRSPSEATPSRSDGDPRAHFERGDSARASDLRGADLSRIDLQNRYLHGIDARRARLDHADLRGAQLSSSRLDEAQMSRADLRRADLRKASLLGTDLWKAELRGTDLRECRTIVMANVRGARFDAATRWPAGFDPIAAGAIKERRRVD